MEANNDNVESGSGANVRRTEAEIIHSLRMTLEKHPPAINTPQAKLYEEGVIAGTQMALLWVLGIERDQLPDAVNQPSKAWITGKIAAVRSLNRALAAAARSSAVVISAMTLTASKGQMGFITFLQRWLLDTGIRTALHGLPQASILITPDVSCSVLVFG
jgi:hypothetical protein